MVADHTHTPAYVQRRVRDERNELIRWVNGSRVPLSNKLCAVSVGDAFIYMYTFAQVCI